MTREILRVVVGSKMWGTDTPTSDTDIKVVVMDPLSTVLDPFDHGTKSEQVKENGIDVTRYELRHFVQLACKGNPTILETLFSSEVLYADPIGDELRRIRELFIDSKAVWRSHKGFIHGQRDEARRRMENNINKKGRPIAKLLSSSIIGALQGTELLKYSTYNPSQLLKVSDQYSRFVTRDFHRELKAMDDGDPRLRKWFPDIDAALTTLIGEMNRAYTNTPKWEVDHEAIREFTYTAYMRATR